MFGFKLGAVQHALTWKIIRPGETLQQTIPSNFKYTLFPVPEGVTAEGLMNVAEKMNWNFRPIKRLGPAKWLIASENQHRRNQEVLVTEVQPKDLKQQQVILTDPQHKKQVPQNPLQISGADPWQSGADPWAQHVARSTGHLPKGPVPAPRQPAGPNQTLSDAQDTKIQALEKKLQDVATGLRDEMQDVQKAQKSDMRELENRAVQHHAFSAKTTFNFPMATPKGHFTLASATVRSVAATPVC